MTENSKSKYGSLRSIRLNQPSLMERVQNRNYLGLSTVKP